jgi:hypothetical protein
MVVDGLSRSTKTLSNCIWLYDSEMVVWCTTITERKRETEGLYGALSGVLLRIDYMVTCYTLLPSSCGQVWNVHHK